jgi:DNA-binding response OmpR family regulator
MIPVQPPEIPRVLPLGKKAKILLVEDEANVAQMVQDWLSEKYDVVTAGDGKTAFQKAATESPDIILEDINLPDMTGLEVIQLLEKDSRTNKIPIIILTGQKMVEDTVKFVSAAKSVKGFVNKPFRLKDFLEKIDLVLSGKAEFVLLEKGTPAAPANMAKAETVRELRAEARREPPPPTITAPPEFSPAVKKGRNSFFGGLCRLVLQVVLFLAVAGAGSELTLRAVERYVGEWIFLPPSDRSGLDAIPVVPRPGAAWERNGIRYGLNSLGLRDGESPAVSTGTFRVLVLGGSVVFGRDVALEETFAKRLEGLMGPAVMGGCRVVNGAVWGLSTSEQWALFEMVRTRLKPDLVVWVAGDGMALRPLKARWEMVAAWPRWAGVCVEKSRLAGLLETLFLYEGGAEESSPDNKLKDRISQFAEAHPETSLVLLTLGKDPSLDGLTEKKNLLRYEIDKIMGPDLSREGLTRGGHKRLATGVYPLLMKNIDSLMRRSVSPPAPALLQAPPSQPKPGPVKKAASRNPRRSR